MKFLSTETLCSSGRLSLIKKKYQTPQGLIIEKSLLNTPDAVTIIPYLDDDTILLIKNYRLSVDQFMWEFPAGTSEGESDFIECAKRELQEETGYTASEWTSLFSFYPTNGFSNYQMHCYKAKNLVYVGQNLDDEEMITVHPIKIKDAYQMLEDGLIKDAKTQLLLYYLKIQD